MMNERIYAMFRHSVETKMEVGETLAPFIDSAATKITNALLNENKVLVCGNGTSAALAQIFASAMIDRFEKERPSLPAIWLGANIASYTGIAAEHSITDVYSKPVRALGQAGDILITISSSGNASNLIQAISAAHARGMHVIALTGRDGGDISTLIDVEDCEIRVAINSRARIHEIHLLTLFCLHDLIDAQLFGMN